MFLFVKNGRVSSFVNMDRPSKTLIRSKSGLKIVAADKDLISPFIICEPEWVPDSEVLNCTNCQKRFGFTTRRHHCRRCGRIYCSGCCSQKLKLPRMCFIDPVRICLSCVPTTIEENEFFDYKLKILTNGATFIIENNRIIKESSEVLQCKLSLDHRHLMFDGVKLAPLELTRISGLNVTKDPETADCEEEDEAALWSIEIEYEMGSKAKVKLACAAELENRKTGSSWISAMQQAFKLLQGYRAD